jgi:hypothetical protein
MFGHDLLTGYRSQELLRQDTLDNSQEGLDDYPHMIEIAFLYASRSPSRTEIRAISIRNTLYYNQINISNTLLNYSEIICYTL